MNSEIFSERLKQAIGAESVNSFAQKCGVSESLLRKYISGSCPGLDKAAAIAKAAKVNIAWLATGEGPMRPGEPSTTPTATLPDDNIGLGESVELLAKIYNSGNPVLIRAIAANLHAFSEAVDNKALAIKTVNMMEEMNTRMTAMEKDLAEMRAEEDGRSKATAIGE